MAAAALGHCVQLRELEIQYCREDRCWGEKIDLNSKAITMSIVLQCWCKLPRAASSTILHSIIHVCCKGNRVIITLCVQHFSKTIFTPWKSGQATNASEYKTSKNQWWRWKRFKWKIAGMGITLFWVLLCALGKHDGLVCGLHFS